MHIRIGYRLGYQHPAPTPLVVMLQVHEQRRADMLVPDAIRTDPAVPLTTYHDSYGNRCTRLLAPPGPILITADALIEDSGKPEPAAWDAWQHPVEDLPDDVLLFLLGSRYCETELLSGFAWQQFGNAPSGWGRVQAICDFVHGHLQFGYGHARPTRTAW